MGIRCEPGLRVLVCDRENFLSGEGMELYAVVPGEDWKMTVYRYGMDPDNDYLPARGEKLYEGGEPVLLQGNISDIVPGFEIVLQRGGDSISYQPCLSLENGRLQQSAGVQDFSPYDLVMPGGMTEFEALAGYWECAYVDPNGNENMLYLTIAEDGGLSYSYGLANSEMAEVFGGSWDMADDCLSFHLTGGILDTELGYVAEPYEFHSLYAYTWGDIGNVLTLRLREDTALLYGTENTDLTFYCVGTVGDFFDPLAGILTAEMDPSLCAGNWFSGHYDDEGYEMVMCLSLLEDGTATYMHGYMSSDSGEWYEGAWTADKEGKLILDMDGGWLDPVEEGEKQHFRGVFRWDLYGRQLGLTHEEGTPLAAGKENWFFGFMPFDYSPYDGEWVAHTDTETCTLSLYSNGEVLCSVAAADGTLKAYYEGWWSVTEAMELELSMLLMEGDGERTVNCLYTMEWMEYPFRLHIQCPAGSYALTDTMAQNGGETFSWIDPDAVG